LKFFISKFGVKLQLIIYIVNILFLLNEKLVLFWINPSSSFVYFCPNFIACSAVLDSLLLCLKTLIDWAFLASSSEMLASPQDFPRCILEAENYCWEDWGYLIQDIQFPTSNGWFSEVFISGKYYHYKFI